MCPVMKVVIAPQSFKGGLSGVEAAKAIGQGVLSVYPQAENVAISVADGGDGTLDALVRGTGGELFTSRVTGPLGEAVSAPWGVMGDGRTAVIEIARASGLALVPPRLRDPRITTSFGTGKLIIQALDRGYRRIIVGLGGSATNDGGAGMAQALGVRFLDSNSENLRTGGAYLSRLARIDISGLRLGIMEAEIIAAADVATPLCGPNGASAVFGPQKGASPGIVTELEKAMANYAQVLKRSLGLDLRDEPMTGAAGGLGAGLVAFANAQIQPGIDLVCDILGLEECLVDAGPRDNRGRPH